MRFQSTLPVWGATERHHHQQDLVCISIHAPRVGSDYPPPPSNRPCGYFNPRSPCGERLARSLGYRRSYAFQSTLPVWGATVGAALTSCIVAFQSTLPVWGATVILLFDSHLRRNFNPRSPCGERPGRADRITRSRAISIHAPRVGSDTTSPNSSSSSMVFQSTLPVWGATRCRPRRGRPSRISIHAPRVGSDPLSISFASAGRRISIHAPRVGSDLVVGDGARVLAISIHAPRVGSDACWRRA